MPDVVLYGANIGTLLALISACIFLLAIRDCMLTDQVIKRGGRERNPFVRWWYGWSVPLVGPVRWAIKLAITVVALWALWTFASPLQLTISLVILFGLMLWVVNHNAAQLR